MKEFNLKLQEMFAIMCSTKVLYRSSITGDQLWKAYLASFSNADNPTFRDPESSYKNCNHCKNFIRRYGNLIALNEKNEIITLFDFDIKGEYSNTSTALRELLNSGTIANQFFETFNMLNELPYEKCTKKHTKFRLGVIQNFKQYTPEEVAKFGKVVVDKIYEFNHMALDIPRAFVDFSGDSVEKLMSGPRSDKEVFQRGMEEIPLTTLTMVRDLIIQGSLFNGDAHIHKVKAMIPLKEEYDTLRKDQKDAWLWKNSIAIKSPKFRNELIGVLCVELTEGDIHKACKNWNFRIDPVNYMNAVAPYTENQKKAAQKFVEENGYLSSFSRRLATLDDIKVTEIKHINSGDGNIKEVSMFDNLKATKGNSKELNFDNIEEVGINKFLDEILPTCSSVEIFLSNSHTNNLVTLTTSNVEDSKPMFKWSNNYSWTFNGNLSGKSELAQKVESAGGRTDGVFRFTQSWNELEPNQSLMDLHVFLPGNNHSSGTHNNYGSSQRVGWNNRNHTASRGSQDVDYVSEAPKGYIPVENITFPDLSRMPDGEYKCKIHNWSYRRSGGRGKAEIAFQGEVHEYIYPKTSNKEWVDIATVTLKNGKFTIEHHLPCSTTSKEVYGVDTNKFHKVNLVCLSPNYWGENKVGNKHFFFMMEDCKVKEDIKGYHSENLNADLTSHRKILEPLASTIMIPASDEQLSGLGFNATVRDEVVLKLGGNFNRTIKVKF